MDIIERPGWEGVTVSDGIPLARHLDTGKVFDLCSRCGGSGQYSFNPLDGTRCFGCNGRGYGKETTIEDAERRARNRVKARARREAKAAAEAEAQQVAAKTWIEEHPALVRGLAQYAEHDDFLADLNARIEQRPLSDRQVIAALDAIERTRTRLADQEARRDLGHLGTLNEKLTVEVTILRAKYFPSQQWNRAGRYLVTMRTQEGHILKTWNSGVFGDLAIDALEREPERPRWTITGTVQEHGEYNDTPETTLTRVKRVS